MSWWGLLSGHGQGITWGNTAHRVTLWSTSGGCQRLKGRGVRCRAFFKFWNKFWADILKGLKKYGVYAGGRNEPCAWRGWRGRRPGDVVEGVGVGELRRFWRCLRLISRHAYLKWACLSFFLGSQKSQENQHDIIFRRDNTSRNRQVNFLAGPRNGSGSELRFQTR